MARPASHPQNRMRNNVLRRETRTEVTRETRSELASVAWNPGQY